VPAANFLIGKPATSGYTYAPASGSASYKVEAATTTCGGSPQTANATGTLAPGTDLNMQGVSFASCQ
jgi:hypothetical protein